MHGMFTYIYDKNQPNVGKYPIHGVSGNVCVFSPLYVYILIYIYVYTFYYLRYICLPLDVFWVDDSCLSMPISPQRKE